MGDLLVVIPRLIPEQTAQHLLWAVENHIPCHRVGRHRQHTHNQRRRKQIPQKAGSILFLHFGFLLIPLPGGFAHRQFAPRQTACFHLADGEKQFFRFHTA